MLGTVVVLGACTLLEYATPVTIHGRVIDETSGQPIDGAVVAATWRHNRRPRGYNCYIETRRTSSDGLVTIKTRLPQPALPGAQTPREYPNVIVHARGYQTSLAELGSVGSRRTVRNEGTERLTFAPPHRTVYLVPSKMDRNDRITYLRVLADAAACTGDDGRDVNGLVLLEALKTEADEIAVTDYDRFVAEWLAYRMQQVRRNSAATPPTPGAVLTAVEAADPWRLAAALRKRDADPDDRDLEGTTALMRASSRGLRLIVEMLLDAGADPARHDFKEAKTSLHAALEGAATALHSDPARHWAYLGIVQSLLHSERIDPAALDVHGRTARSYLNALPPEILALFDQTLARSEALKMQPRVRRQFDLTMPQEPVPIAAPEPARFWSKEGASRTEGEEDARRCQEAAVGDEAFRQCMISKGWSLTQ